MKLMTKAILSPIRNVIQKKNYKRNKEIEYKGLLEILITSGLVVYQGRLYKSIADLTIEFYLSEKIRC